jgi:hypothetical protein
MQLSHYLKLLRSRVTEGGREGVSAGTRDVDPAADGTGPGRLVRACPCRGGPACKTGRARDRARRVVVAAFPAPAPVCAPPVSASPAPAPPALPALASGRVLVCGPDRVAVSGRLGSGSLSVSVPGPISASGGDRSVSGSDGDRSVSAPDGDQSVSEPDDLGAGAGQPRDTAGGASATVEPPAPAPTWPGTARCLGCVLPRLQQPATAGDLDAGGAYHPLPHDRGAYPLRRRSGSPIRAQAMIIFGPSHPRVTVGVPGRRPGGGGRRSLPGRGLAARACPGCRGRAS